MRQIAATTTIQPSLWKNKTFPILLFSGFLLAVGNKLYEIVLPLIMLEITHSPISMTTMRTAELLPNMIFGVFIGVWVDQVNKKHWVLWMVGIQTGLLFLIVYLFNIHYEVLNVYYVIGFLLMTFNYGYFNAQVSLTKEAVHESLLTSANAKFSLTETFVSVFAPAFTGLVFLLANLSDGILLTATCYLISFVLLNQLSLKNRQNSSRNVQFVKDLKEGWSFFISNKILLSVTVFVVFLNCTSTVVSTTILYYGKSSLHLSSSFIAIILSISGIGGIAGSLLINKLRTKIGIGKIFGIGMILNAIGYGNFLISKNIYCFCLSLFLIGFAISMHTISVYTIRHEQTPSFLMGRIGGITGTIFRIAMPFTMFFSGYMLIWWGASSIFLSAFIWNLIIFVFYLFTKLWKLV